MENLETAGRTEPAVRPYRFSIFTHFEFVSDFDIRISNFPPHRPGMSSKRKPFKYSVSGNVVMIG